MINLANLRVGFYLAYRQIRRASLWTTGLTIFVMVLTFLNLVVVSGVLVGLIQGAINATREGYIGDVIISTLDDKEYIENSANLIAALAAVPEIEHFTPRYREAGVLEANYKTRKETDKPNTAGVQLVGIDPSSEQAVTNLADKVVEGSYLEPGDYDQVLLGQYLLTQYIPVETPAFSSLDRVGVGTKIRMKVGDVTREVTVKGIIKAKVDEVSMSAYMVDSQFRSMIGRSDGNVDEISIQIRDGADPVSVREALKRLGADRYAKVQTFEEGQPKFLKDMITTFNMLGTAFSSIGLIVAAITIFIVIFINALTRRKYIGILKGIGVNGHAIEISYVLQSIFYATIGSVIGIALVYAVLIPAIATHPIDFPFSDGILVAPVGQTALRMSILIAVTIIAGFVPAWMIVRKNTLDSILGRN